MLVASFSFCQTDVVKFDKKSIKFSKVDEGKKITLTYHFRNLGKHTLTLLPPEVDCSCTEVTIPENTIAGGDRDSIVVHFDTKDKIGYQERDVKLNFVSDFMDGKSIEKKITFKGVVKTSKTTKEVFKTNNRKD